MKLLKLPSKLHDGQLTQCQVYGERLYVIGGKWLSVWNTNRLLECAQGILNVKEVKEEAKVELPLLEAKQEEGRWLIVLNEGRVVYGSDHVLAYLDLSEPEGAPREILDLIDSEALTDLKYDGGHDLLFVSLSKSNSILLIEGKSGETKGTIELKSKPISVITDPLGQLLCVILQNRSIQIFQYDAHGSTKLHQTINQFVQTNPLPYRMTMSPQGDVVPMINSLQNNNVPTAVLLDRLMKFKIKSSLVGYVSDCKILKFSPRLYSKSGSAEEPQAQTYNLLASSGNQDGNVVVWNTSRIKPLFDASKVVNSYITDLDWDLSGLGLFAVSQDGQLVIFSFQEAEVGDVMNNDATAEAKKQVALLEPLPLKLKVEEKDTKPIVSKVVSQVSSSHSKKQSKVNEVSVSSSNTMEFNQPSFTVPKDLKRKPPVEDPLLIQDKPLPKKQKKDLDQMDFLDTNLVLPSVSFSKVRLAHPKIRLSFQYTNSDENLILDVKNGSGNDQKPTTITLTRKDKESEKQLFQTFLPKFVTLCTAGENFWAWSTDTGNLYVSSVSGQELFPPLILGTPISFLESCGNYLLCITSIGQMYCWNVPEGKLHFPINDIYPLLNPMLRYSDDVLSRAENITMCTITSNGVPIITLSNGDGYMFDLHMETWMLINDSWWAYGSQYWNFMTSSGMNLSDKTEEKKSKFWNKDAEILVTEITNNQCSIINYLETKTNDELSRKGRMKHLQRFAKVLLMKEGFENLEEVVTLAHLENKILVSLRLNEIEELILLLKIYCLRLAEMGYTDRFGQTLSWLYDFTNPKFALLNETKRQELIKDIIIACANIRQVQRITTSYASELGIIHDSI